MRSIRQAHRMRTGLFVRFIDRLYTHEDGTKVFVEFAFDKPYLYLVLGTIVIYWCRPGKKAEVIPLRRQK